MSDTPTAEDLRQQMRQVRRDLGAGVEEIVDQARSLTDWQHYVKSHPVACLSAAAIIGYLLVPSRRPVIRAVVNPLAGATAVDSVTDDVEVKSSAPPGLFSKITKALLTTAIQGGISIVQQQVNHWLAAQLQAQAERAQQSSEVTPP